MSKINLADHLNAVPPSIKEALQNIPEASRYFVALSGGIDSVVLLHSALPVLRDRGAELSAVHIHHGLNARADEWAQFCVNLCDQLGVECIVERVNVVLAGEGLESAARLARYKVFERLLEQGGVMLQGHHLNDQAETFFLRAAKALGPEALSGIPQSRVISEGYVYRPFLSVARSVIEDWATSQSLGWVHDDSNDDTQFDRNFIRQDILPKLESRWSNIVGRLAKAASRVKEQNKQLDEWHRFYLSSMRSMDSFGQERLSLDILAELPFMLQKSILRYWLNEFEISQPSDAIFTRVWTELIPAQSDANPEVRWDQHRLVRFDGYLYYLAVTPLMGEYEFVYAREELKSPQVITVGGFKICLGVESGSSLSETGETYCLYLPESCKRIVFRNRRGGERLRGQMADHSQSLKKCYQDWKVPPWLRDSPLLFFDDELVFTAVGKITEGYHAQSGSSVLRISVESLAS